jgi:hypothetical protein
MEDAPQKYYEENPYQANTPRGGVERMSVVRAALTLSLAIIISVGMIVLFLHNKDRFTIIPQNKGVFVFDYKNSSLSFCDNKGCTLISINADRYPSREMSFMPQGLMQPMPQHPLGFINPNAVMPQTPFINPQYPPNIQPPYLPQQNFQPQGFNAQGFGGFQNQQPIAAQPLPIQQNLLQPQQQQSFQEPAPPLPQKNFAPTQQDQGQQDQRQVQQDQGQQDQGQQDQGQQDQGQQDQGADNQANNSNDNTADQNNNEG